MSTDAYYRLRVQRNAYGVDYDFISAEAHPEKQAREFLAEYPAIWPEAAVSLVPAEAPAPDDASESGLELVTPAGNAPGGQGAAS